MVTDRFEILRGFGELCVGRQDSAPDHNIRIEGLLPVEVAEIIGLETTGSVRPQVALLYLHHQFGRV